MTRIGVESRMPGHEEMKRVQFLRCFHKPQPAIVFDSRCHAASERKDQFCAGKALQRHAEVRHSNARAAFCTDSRQLLVRNCLYPGIVVATYAGVQTIPDKQLAAVGAKRSSCIRVPYFGVALQCLPGTELVLTLTSGMTSAIKNDRRLRLVKAPQELHTFHFLMAWHPRLNTDPRHVWLREAVRSTVAANGNPEDCWEYMSSHAYLFFWLGRT